MFCVNCEVKKGESFFRERDTQITKTEIVFNLNFKKKNQKVSRVAIK